MHNGHLIFGFAIFLSVLALVAVVGSHNKVEKDADKCRASWGEVVYLRARILCLAPGTLLEPSK